MTEVLGVEAITPVQEQLRRASNTVKAFGVADPHRGGKYIFVQAPAFEHFAVWGLAEGHRVLVDVTEGRKGPEALSVRLIRATPC